MEGKANKERSKWDETLYDFRFMRDMVDQVTSCPHFSNVMESES